MQKNPIYDHKQNYLLNKIELHSRKMTAYLTNLTDVEVHKELANKTKYYFLYLIVGYIYIYID